MNCIRILLLALVITIPARACLNVQGTSIDGGSATGSGIFPALPIRNAIKSSPEDRFNELSRNRDTKWDDEFTDRELEGVANVFMGRYEQAIAIFEKIEADRPGRYSTASNLGTAYELKGNLDLALKWIAEGIRRNPESHHGTEWLHLEIIKTRIRLAGEPDYLTKNHIIDLPETVSNHSPIKIDGQVRPAAVVREALKYQLTERVYFVKPPDPVVSDLLYTYGVLEAHASVVEAGIKLLELSREYGNQNSKQLDQTIEHYQSLVLFRKIRFGGLIALGALGVIVFLVFAYRKKWFFLTRSEYRKHQLAQQQQFG
ncbi:MAG: tetratricopeptide repeat protein [Verrucomicrobiota bacterium]